MTHIFAPFLFDFALASCNVVYMKLSYTPLSLSFLPAISSGCLLNGTSDIDAHISLTANLSLGAASLTHNIVPPSRCEGPPNTATAIHLLSLTLNP